MLYFITLLLVGIIIGIFLIIRNQWAMMKGQVITTKNQVFMSDQLDAVLSKSFNSNKLKREKMLSNMPLKKK